MARTHPKPRATPPRPKAPRKAKALATRAKLSRSVSAPPAPTRKRAAPVRARAAAHAGPGPQAPETRAAIDQLDWDDLRFFLAAAQVGSLAGAARALRVEHTTVGRRLSALERELGAAVVLRGPDGLTLTDLGEQLRPLAERMAHLVQSGRELAQTQRARVRLALPSGFGALFTAQLQQLRGVPAGSMLELVSGAGIADLRRGDADLAVRAVPIQDKDLITRKLGSCGFALYAAPSYLARRPAAADPTDLRGHDLIGFDRSLAAAPFARWLAERSRGTNIVLRSREMTDMRAAAVSGVGLAALPCILGDADPALQRITPEVITSIELTLVYRREVRESRQVRAVIRFVIDVMLRNAAAIRG